MSEEPDSDKHLLELAARRDQDAIQTLINRYRGRLRSMVAARMDQRLRSRVDPSDVVQDVLLKAVQKLPRYSRSPIRAFYPWLRQIAWDHLLDLHRHHVRVAKRTVNAEVRLTLPLSDESAVMLVQQLAGRREASPSIEAARSETVCRVREALDQLPAADRELLVMRYAEQLPLGEIAIAMSLSESATKSRHIRALEKLAKFVDRSDFGPGD